MPQETSPDFFAILEALVRQSVDFVVVGGVCAVLDGAPLNTFDLDVLHATNPANVARLLEALAFLDAHYRAQPEKKLRPQASHLSSPGHQLLMTRFGPLDLLGSLTGGRTYEDLLPHTTEMDVGENVRVRVLDLETLIEVKEQTGGEKDKAALPILRALLREKRLKPGT